MKRTLQTDFLSIPNYLLRASNLSAFDKQVIAYILGWQRDGKKCTASNQYMADEFGVELRTLTRCITKLGKTPFFQAKPERKSTDKGGHFNKSTKIVFEDLLKQYIAEGKLMVKETVADEPEVKEGAVIAPEPAPVQLSEIQVSSTGIIQPDEPWTEKRTHKMCKQWVEELDLDNNPDLNHWTKVVDVFETKIRLKRELDTDTRLAVEGWMEEYCEKYIQPLFMTVAINN